MKKLKDLKDGQTFRFRKDKKVTWKLIKKHEKARTVTITSLSSERSTVRKWGIEVYIGK